MKKNRSDVGNIFLSRIRPIAQVRRSASSFGYQSVLFPLTNKRKQAVKKEKTGSL
jgi:hypothetical protein